MQNLGLESFWKIFHLHYWGSFKLSSWILSNYNYQNLLGFVLQEAWVQFSVCIASGAFTGYGLDLILFVFILLYCAILRNNEIKFMIAMKFVIVWNGTMALRTTCRAVQRQNATQYASFSYIPWRVELAICIRWPSRRTTRSARRVYWRRR